MRRTLDDILNSGEYEKMTEEERVQELLDRQEANRKRIERRAEREARGDSPVRHLRRKADRTDPRDPEQVEKLRRDIRDSSLSEERKKSLGRQSDVERIREELRRMDEEDAREREDLRREAGQIDPGDRRHTERVENLRRKIRESESISEEKRRRLDRRLQESSDAMKSRNRERAERELRRVREELGGDGNDLGDLRREAEHIDPGDQRDTERIEDLRRKIRDSESIPEDRKRTLDRQLQDSSDAMKSRNWPRAERELKKVQEELRRLEEEDRREAEELRREQKSIEEDTKKLAEDMKSNPDTRKVADKTGDAGKDSGLARENLEKNDSERARKDAAEAERKLREVREELRKGERREPPPKSEEPPRQETGGSGPSVSLPFFEGLLYAICIIVCVILLVLAIRKLMGLKRVKKEKPDEKKPKAVLEPSEPRTLLEMADAEASRSRYVEAIRLCHRAALLGLDRRRVVKFHESFTNGEYRRQLAQSPERGTFESLAGRFELAYFGRVPAGDGEFRECRRAAQALVGEEPS